MAGRNVKRDLVFFRLDCDILRDRKIRRLRRRFGSDGLIVYLSLLCEIYRDNGYYIVHDDDLIPDIADMCDIDEKRTAEIFDECIDAGLFDRELYKSKHILSSKGIQARYLDIMAGLRRKGGIDVDLCLISSDKRREDKRRRE